MSWEELEGGWAARDLALNSSASCPWAHDIWSFLFSSVKPVQLSRPCRMVVNVKWDHIWDQLQHLFFRPTRLLSSPLYRRGSRGSERVRSLLKPQCPTLSAPGTSFPEDSFSRGEGEGGGSGVGAVWLSRTVSAMGGAGETQLTWSSPGGGGRRGGDWNSCAKSHPTLCNWSQN